jgi:O-antigen/teichoic acid export membrane protein
MPFNLSIKNMCRYQGSGSSFLKLNTTTDAMKLVLLGVFIPFFKIYGIIIALALTEFLSFFILLIWFIRSNKKFVVK